MALNKENILRITDKGLSVFRHYISIPFRLGKNFLNPLYSDKKASCNIYYDRRSNCYRLKDFGNDEYSGDCFDFVGKMSGLDCNIPHEFIQILEKINDDLSLGLKDIKNPETQKKKKTLIHDATFEIPTVRKPKPYTIQKKEYSSNELSWWMQYGINEKILKEYNVFPLSRFESENKDGKPYYFKSSINEPIYAYLSKQHIKIYRPSSDIRFLQAGDVPTAFCFGLKQLPIKGDTLFITGGEKDVLSLASKGFHAICFNSETSHIPLDTVQKLSYRFKHIILLFDVDETGLKSSEKQLQHLHAYGVKRLLLPLCGSKQEKDISDYFRLGKSREDLFKLFLDYLENIYSETMTALKSCEVDFNNPPPVAKMIVSINNVPIGTQGNLLCVTGGEGIGKSNYVASFISGVIRNEDTLVDSLGMEVCANDQSKAVLFYDTEQSESQLYKNIGNVLRRANIEEMPDYLHAYCLTGMSRKERLQAIVRSMDKFYYQYSGIHLVVIDGIADLVRSANDESESIAVVEELFRLAGIYNTCIVTVLHFIPNGLKLRGHLGSELQRKASSILSIERDDNPAISVVKALKVRDGSPFDVPLMQFSWNKELDMHTYLGEKPHEFKEKRKENELHTVAKNIFKIQSHITYVELCEQLQFMLDVKERTAKSYIKFMRERKIIAKDPSNHNYFISFKTE